MIAPRAGTAFTLALLPLALACVEERSCDLSLHATPTGSIRWTDGVARLPDRIHVHYAGRDQPEECEFEPAEPDEDGVSYTCWEGREGPATLSVLLDRQRWNRSFRVEDDGCHAAPLTLDLELDPAAGEAF